MKIFKIVLLTLISVFVLLCVLVKVNEPKTILIAGEEVSLEGSWRVPTDVENIKVRSQIRMRGFSECGNTYLKNIYSNVCIVACGIDKEMWEYYWLNFETNDFMPLANEIQDKIDPPN